jgi:hypothetical protein
MNRLHSLGRAMMEDSRNKITFLKMELLRQSRSQGQQRRSYEDLVSLADYNSCFIAVLEPVMTAMVLNLSLALF